MKNPRDYFHLIDKEGGLTEKNGLYVDGFQRTFCRTMKEVAEEIASSISPLNPARVAAVEEVLDDLIRKFPLTDLEVFYVSYLSWDDTFRSAIRNDPSHVPALTEACCDAVCYVSFAVHANKGQSAELLAYCAKIEDEFNAVSEALTRGHSAEPTIMTSNLLDQTMHLSRTLAHELTGLDDVRYLGDVNN